MAPLKTDTDLDYYEVLDILPSANVKEIKKAYRKKALKCHPDKNPDNIQAAEEWETLSKALEVLTDESAKAAYDKVLKAKKAAELRNRALDSKRKKFKQDLENRETANQNVKETAERAAQRLAQEIKRLREEGSRILEEEKMRLKQELKEASSKHTDEFPKLKVKWKSKKEDESNGGYSDKYLRQCLQQYGDVSHLIVSRKKNGSAIVEFATVEDAEHAISNAVGLPNNPLQLTWLSGRPIMTFNSTTKEENGGDFEKMVLEKMRRAEQKKTKIDIDLERDGTEPKVVNEEDILQKLKEVQRLSKVNNVPKHGESSMQFSFQSFKTSKSGGDMGEQSNFFKTNSKTGFDKRESKLQLDTAEARDFESIAMMELRRAVERRKLIAQMEKEDS